MDALEIVEECLRALDSTLPINIGQTGPYNVVVVRAAGGERRCSEYLISDSLVGIKGQSFSEDLAFYSCLPATRVRAQIEKPNLELFPFVSFDRAGSFRSAIKEELEKEEELEAIDCRLFHKAVNPLWKAAGKKSLPLIAKLVPGHASDVIYIVDQIKVG